MMAEGYLGEEQLLEVRPDRSDCSAYPVSLGQ